MGITILEIGSVTPPTPAADWWSVGAIMFEMLTGKVSFV